MTHKNLVVFLSVRLSMVYHPQSWTARGPGWEIRTSQEVRVQRVKRRLLKIYQSRSSSKKILFGQILGNESSRELFSLILFCVAFIQDIGERAYPL